MVKKKGITPKLISAYIAAFILICGGIVTVAGYITLPDRVEATENKVGTIEDYIQEQQIQNRLTREMLERKEIIYSKNRKHYWDDQTREWVPVRYLRK